MTGDGVLVARHEPVIGGTTNVASLAQFANRRTTQQIDGVSYADNWFAEDLSLAELKTLRAIQTRGRSTAFDKQFEVPTLAEVIALAKAKSTELGRPIGIYPEVKHATSMTGVSLAQGRAATYFEDRLLSTLHPARGLRQQRGRAGVHPELRGRQPAIPQWQDQAQAGAAGRCRRRQRQRLDVAGGAPAQVCQIPPEFRRNRPQTERKSLILLGSD